MENRLEREISACWAGEQFDDQRALDLLRANVVDIFELHLKFYGDNGTFAVRLIPSIMTASLTRVERCFANHFSGDSGKFRPVLIRTLREHLQRQHWGWWHELNQPAPSEEQRRAGIDMASASLLMKAATPQTAPLIGSMPPRTLLTTPPKPKRLSAQVDCRPAAVLIDKYISSNAISLTELATKAQTTDRTLRRLRKDGKIHRDVLKRLAKAMNIGLDRLIG